MLGVGGEYVSHLGSTVMCGYFNLGGKNIFVSSLIKVGTFSLGCTGQYVFILTG